MCLSEAHARDRLAPPLVQDKLFTTTLDAMAGRPSSALRTIFKSHARRPHGRAQINLNEYWDVLEQLMRTDPPHSANGDHDMANEINENLSNERQEGQEVQPERQEVQYERQEVQHERPEVQHERQEVQHERPEVQHERPEVQHERPEVQHERPEVQHQRQEVQHERPEVQHERPEVQHERPEVQHERQEVQHERPEVQHERPEVQHEQANNMEVEHTVVAQHRARGSSRRKQSHPARARCVRVRPKPHQPPKPTAPLSRSPLSAVNGIENHRSARSPCNLSPLSSITENFARRLGKLI